ncbi:MAG: hydrogenase expression/formation protein HypE [Dehalococcoidales bacterium]
MPMKDKVLLAHGSGGKLGHDLVEKNFLSKLGNPWLNLLDDAAILELSGRIAFTTDSYVVSPLFFPGGDIGKLAVCGTVNDLAMSGARPIYLSLSLIIEEGFPLADLDKIVASVQRTAKGAGVKVVTGDTKVVNRGSADKLFINTAGVGFIPPGVNIAGSNAQPGDGIIVSGPVGNHGMAVMSQREGLEFSSLIESDCAPLNGLVADMLKVSSSIHCLRDPTRGGLATSLNELARQSRVGIIIEEAKIPVRQEVRAMCELLGLDPLHIANEGRLVAIVAGDETENVLVKMRQNPLGQNAAIIGQVTAEHPRRVVMRTSLGTSRLVDMLTGDLLPRIC